MVAIPSLLMAVTAAVLIYGAVRNRRPGDRSLYGISATSFALAALMLLACA
jgi:hypothetical protein